MLAYWPAKLHMVMGVCLLAFLQHWTGVHAQFGLLGGAVAGLTGGLLQAGTPAVAYTGSLLGGLGLGIPAVTPTATQPATTTYTQPTTTYYTTSNPVTNPFGWLFPVYTPARRSNCVVYEVRRCYWTGWFSYMEARSGTMGQRGFKDRKPGMHCTYCMQASCMQAAKHLCSCFQ